MKNPETFHAKVWPMTREWGDNPLSLFFKIQPPINPADPVGIGDVISNNLDDATGRVRITPVVGNSDETSTSGYLIRGYRPEIGYHDFFGEIDRVIEQDSVQSALRQLVGDASCEVEFIDIPFEV